MIKIAESAQELRDELYEEPETPNDRALHFYSYETSGMTFEQKLEDTEFGDICELAVKKYLNGIKVDWQEGYDLDVNGEHVEVKSIKNFKTWWNLPSSNYDFMRKNIAYIDSVILCTIIDDEVYMIFKANAKTFFKNVKQSKFNGGYYYNHHNPDCIEY